MNRAIHLQRLMIGFHLTIVTLFYFVMGNSQAMRTAWYEDMLGFLPPIVFLIGIRLETKAPTVDYPYGYLGAATIAVLCASCALVALGLWLLIEAIIDLAMAHRPNLGAISIAGHSIWIGWLMLPAIAYGVVPPFVFGRLLLPLAEKLHDKTLYANADMNKADWQTGLATASGVVGVGFGYWWADAAAAGLISLSILRDGLGNLVSATRIVVDHRPTDLQGKPLDVDVVIREAFESIGVRCGAVRLREQGRFIQGEVEVHASQGVICIDEVDAVLAGLRRRDWRIIDLAVASENPVWSYRRRIATDGGVVNRG